MVYYFQLNFPQALRYRCLPSTLLCGTLGCFLRRKNICKSISTEKFSAELISEAEYN